MSARQGRRAGRQLAVLLDAHRQALATCRRCQFDDADVVPVLSDPTDPVAMLVGQAPGKTEVVDRRPFAGRAGRTLFRWLAEAGIEESVARRRIYISAMTRCYPGPSPTGRGDRVPSPAEIGRCSAWLDAELELIAPRVIIPVGRLAIERFLGSRPLDQLVGRVHQLTRSRSGRVAIPLPHPSGASSWIHAPGHRDLVQAALRLVAEHLPELVRESRRRVA